MEIIICDKCLGSGRICWDVGSHKSDMVYGDCDKCGGSGRVVEEVITEHKPFVSGRDCNAAEIF